MPSSCETIRSVFEEAQRGFQHHAKLIRSLKKIQDGFSSKEDFLESFVDHLRHVMIVFKREPAVERIIEFVAKYSTSNVHFEALKQKSDNLSGDEDEECENIFLRNIILFILSCNEAKDKAIRFRACQLIHKILSNMDDEASIDDEIADNILECMLKRLTDKIPTVRVQAVYALSRLQDPTDDECPVMTSYLQMMATDSSADVRKAVLLNIALNRKSLLEVIARTHDVTESVRKIAYRVIAEKVRLQSLSIAQRVQLLHDGLNDRSPAIQDVCAKNLLQGWLKSLQSNVIDLLKSLDIENSADTAEKAMKVILKVMPKEELQEQIKTLHSDPNSSGPIKIPYDDLDSESAFYWRCLGQHLKSLGVEGEELFDMLLPEVSGFCEYLQRYIDKVFTTEPVYISTDGKVTQKTFVAQQLLMLLSVVDLSDEVGRKRLGQLIHDILVSPYTPESLVALLLARHSQVQQQQELRIQELVEIIADVRQPIVMVESAVSKEEERQKELKLASIKVKLMQLNDELEDSVSTQNFTKAAEIKQQITELEDQRSSINESASSVSMAVREEKDDPVTLLKCLTIACEMLQPVTRNGLNPTLLTLVETLVLPGVQNEDPQVRNAAVKCLGLCALLSCEFARNHLVLFLQVAQVDLELVQLTALQVVFDLLLKFGLEAFKLNPNKDLDNEERSETEKSDDNEDENNGSGNEEENEKEEENAPDTTAMSVLGILTGLLENESNDIRNTAAEGLAKLLISGRVLSAKLLSRLILLWYNPTTEDDGNLRHCIGVFLPVFAFASRSNQELVEEAFLPTLKTLFSAPSSSPMASINSNNVAELLIELTNSRHLTSNTNSTTAAMEGCSHVALGLKVANEIITDPQAPGTRVLCKVLTSLDLDGCDQTSVGDLKVVAYQLYQAVDDSGCSKLLEKFQKTLDQMETTTIQDEETKTIEEAQENNSNDGEEESADVLTSSQEREQSDNPTVNDNTHVTSTADATEDDQTQRLQDHSNNQDASSLQENAEILSSQASQKDDLPTKTPKSKTSRPRKQNTASKVSARVSTSRRVRPKRNASVSSIKPVLNLSDSETSDKENAVF